MIGILQVLGKYSLGENRGDGNRSAHHWERYGPGISVQTAAPEEALASLPACVSTLTFLTGDVATKASTNRH